LNSSEERFYISVESLRINITRRLIPLFFTALFITTVISFSRIPMMGFPPLMIVQLVMVCAAGGLLFARNRLRADHAALVMVGIFSLYVICGAASMGLLSATFVLGPIISLYLMLLGHRRSAYASIVLTFVFLCVIGALFVSGKFDYRLSPDEYVHSLSAWLLMIFSITLISASFVVPFELIPGVLEGSEERFREAMENANVGICLTGLDGHFLMINDEMCRLLGYDRQELGQLSVMDITYRDDLEKTRAFIEGAPNGREEKINLEKRFVCKNGGLLWANVSSALLRDHQRKPLYFITHVRNITQTKTSEQELKQALEWQEAIFQGSRDSVFITDRTSRFVAVNDAACALTGYPREQLLTMRIPDLHDQPDLAAYEKYHQRIFDGEEIVSEAKILRRDGTKIDVEFSNRPITVVGSSYMHTTGRDISERKQTEDALLESEERYQRISNAVTDYIYTVHVVDGRPVETVHGPGCATVTGYESSEFAAKPYLWFEMIAPEDRAMVEEQSGRILRGEETSPIEHRITHKNGGVRWVRNTFVPHRGARGELSSYDGLIQDITERKVAEQALQESETKYRSLVEEFADAIAIYVDGKIVFANSASAGLMRASSTQELIGKSVIDLVHPDYRALIATRMAEVLTNGKPLPLLEEKFIRLDGTVVDVEVKALPVSFGSKAGVQIVVRDISERKQAEAALRESQARYRAMIEQSSEGITIADLDGRYIMVNPAYCMMTQYSESELLTMHVSDLLLPQSSLKLFKSVAAENKIGSREVELKRKDGTTFIALISGAPLEIGNKRYVQGIVQDITDRKRAEEELRESEERFHTMFEMHDAAMLIIEPDSARILDANPAAERFYGYAGAQLRTMTIHDINMMPVEKVSGEMLRASSSQKNTFFFLHKLANGENRFVEVHSSPISIGGKQRLFSIIHDITERKKAEEQLRKLSVAVEQSPVSIIITDTKGCIEYVNPKFTEVTGYANDEVLGKKPSILKSGETPDKEYKHLWDTISSGKEWRGELHNKKKNGELFWEIASISPVRDENNAITNYLAVKEDITERKRAEEALRHAQKLEGIGTLAGGIAHDFNNLLNAIIGQSSLALGRLPKESPAEGNISKALKAAERAADLTRQLLAYSGKGKFLSEDFDLNKLVEENAQLLEVSVPKSSHLRYDLDTSVLCMRGDMGQIQQVVMNLIINAGEALGTKAGHITVCTRRIEITERDSEYWKYTNNPLPPGAYVSFQVNDSGHGISSQVMARIFDPFFTTKFTGRGLGLAAVLGIIKGHHGGIRISSEKGKGSEFEVIFPYVNSSGSTASQETDEASPINGRGESILLIDDEPAILEMLADVLTDANFTVLQASNPADGIALYREHSDKVSLVVLDYSMPGMDGKAAFNELVKINKAVKVLLCSGYTEEEIRSAFGGSAPEGFLQKPYKPNALLHKASAMLARRSS